MLKYFGWILSIVLLAVTVLVYTQTSAAASQNKKVADNLTASYQAAVAQSNRIDADWRAKFTALNTTWSAQYAQVQATSAGNVKAEVDKAVAAATAQLQTLVNAAVTSATANINAQWQATYNDNVKKELAARDATWNASVIKALADRDAQWLKVLADNNITNIKP